MNLSQVMTCLFLAAAATIVAVRLVPRGRRQFWFEIILWLGTVLVAFLGSVLAIAAATELAALQGLRSLAWQGTPLLPATLGALGGALLLNVPLSVIGGQEVAGEDATTSSNQTREG
jgi:hypothetical protein